MSTRALTLVWDQGPDDPILRFILLTLADGADNDGLLRVSGDILPHLLRKVPITPEEMDTCLGRLQATGWLSITDKAGVYDSGVYDHWAIDLSGLDDMEAYR